MFVLFGCGVLGLGFLSSLPLRLFCHCAIHMHMYFHGRADLSSLLDESSNGVMKMLHISELGTTCM